MIRFVSVLRERFLNQFPSAFMLHYYCSLNWTVLQKETSEWAFRKWSVMWGYETIRLCHVLSLLHYVCVWEGRGGVHVHMMDKLVTSVVREVCCWGPRGSATSSQGKCGYISVMATLKFHVLLKNNSGTFVTGDTFISYELQNIYWRNSLYRQSKRQTMIQLESCNALPCVLLAFICRYLIPVLRYKFFILDACHPDSIFICARMWGSMVILKRHKGSVSKNFG
jgi:hypothetical protein